MTMKLTPDEHRAVSIWLTERRWEAVWRQDKIEARELDHVRRALRTPERWTPRQIEWIQEALHETLPLHQ